jgi:hypothetical protein
MVYRKIIGELEREIRGMGCIYDGSRKRSTPVSKYPIHPRTRIDGKAIEKPRNPPAENASDYQFGEAGEVSA